jgi:(2Fe-2S) ferredoxin
MSEQEQQLQSVAAKLGIGAYQRHVLLCTGPNCCSSEEGLRAWEALKHELKNRNLLSGERACYRTKVGCLRICCHGPTMVVYPEGTWYHGMTAEKIPHFVEQHLVEGKEVAEWVFAHNPLEQTPPSTAGPVRQVP